MQVRGKGRLAVSRSTYCGLISSSTASGIALDINLILRHSAAQGMHRACWRLHSSPLRVRAWLIGIDWRMRGDVLQLSGGAAALHTGQWTPVAEQPPQAKRALSGQQLLCVEHCQGRRPVAGAAKVVLDRKMKNSRKNTETVIWGFCMHDDGVKSGDTRKDPQRSFSKADAGGGRRRRPRPRATASVASTVPHSGRYRLATVGGGSAIGVRASWAPCVTPSVSRGHIRDVFR